MIQRLCAAYLAVNAFSVPDPDVALLRAKDQALFDATADLVWKVESTAPHSKK